MNHEKHEKKSKSLVPELRFPEFRDAGEWGTRGLGEFITERNEFPKESVSLFSLTIEDGITPKTKRYERSFLVNDEVNAYKLVLPDDFAYNPMNLRFGAIGRHSGTENVAVSKYYNIFFCDKTVDSKFCELYFKSDKMIAFYDNMAIGSLIEKRRVHFSEFLKFNIRFPLLPEQQKIADCLSSLDELITAEAKKLDTLKAHKKGLMQQLFLAEGETVPRLRFPEFRDAGEWEERELGKEATIVMGASPKSEFYNEENIGLPLLQGNTDIKNRVSAPRIFTSQITKECQKGNILLSVRAPVGTVAKSLHHACIGRGIAAIRANKDNSQEFLYQWLFAFEPQWQNISQGGTFDAVKSDDLRQLTIAFPKIPEQQKIADCLSSLDELITAEAQKLDTLKDHKKGLMQGLFPSADEVGV